ncbi:MAG: hypothetical protein ACYDCO_01290 [Armatimonadota bacterium]
MIDIIEQTFLESLRMLEDGIRKIPDSHWRQGNGEFLIPARIAYHTMIGLEWFFSNLPEAEHKRTRRYNLNWKGPVEDFPDRGAMLEDLAWMTGRVREWFVEWTREAAAGADRPFRLKKALYFLRHTQHHVGEFCAAARLLGDERPAWEFPPNAPESIRNNP